MQELGNVDLGGFHIPGPVLKKAMGRQAGRQAFSAGCVELYYNQWRTARSKRASQHRDASEATIPDLQKHQQSVTTPCAAEH